MIHINVTDQSSGHHMRFSPQWGMATVITDERTLEIYPLVNLESAPETYSVDVQAGSPPVTGDRLWGTMRDKTCKHLNATGTISLPGSTHISGIDSMGHEYVTSQSKGNFPIDSYSYWDQSVDVSKSIDQSGTFWNSPYWSYIGPSSARTRLMYDGHDSLIVVMDYVMGSRFDDGVERSGSGHSRTIVDCFRRVGSGETVRCELVDSWRVYGRLATGSELTALLASTFYYGSPWGNAYGITDLVLVEAACSLDAYINLLISAVQDHLRTMDLHMQETHVDFGELALECAAQLKVVQQNVLLLLLDVADWKRYHSMWVTFTDSRFWKEYSLPALERVVQGLKPGYRSPQKRDVKRLLDPLSSTYLSANYGVLPSISDTRRLFEGVSRLSSLFLKKQRLHSRRVTSVSVPNATYATHTAVFTVQLWEYDDSIVGRVQKLFSGLRAMGVYPEATNLWDIIPFSFVVDWFVDFGAFFKDIDNVINMKSNFPVDYCIMSEKWEQGIDATLFVPEIPVTGEVQFSYYVRQIRGEVPLPTVSLEAEFTAHKHGLEALALWIQRV